MLSILLADDRLTEVYDDIASDIIDSVACMHSVPETVWVFAASGMDFKGSRES